MAIYRYPPEVHEFVKEWAPKLRDRELAEACNEKLGTSFTASSMKAFRGNHEYKNGMKRYYTKEEYWKHQTHYPQGMYEFIRDNSWGVSSAEMARMVEEKFGVHFTPTNMKQFRQRHKIRSGLTGWFQKNHPPGNKGKKLECADAVQKRAASSERASGRHGSRQHGRIQADQTADGRNYLGTLGTSPQACVGRT